MLRATLMVSGLELSDCFGAGEAMPAIDQARPELPVLDVGLPGEDGSRSPTGWTSSVA